ncbi:MAG TPA: hypothetical protein VMI10_12230 [Terriglobales bacterium]|nr:hypothetical protein [Terriglobales bacterium]
MKFAKTIFWIAAIWGFLILTPLYFMFNVIGKQDPPPITHPAFYYGFIGAGLAWQLAFLIIATDPIRFRPIIPAAVVEKFTYAFAMIALFTQSRVHASDMIFASSDLLLGILFIVAFRATRAQNARPS